jgi:hypothetical protein
MMLPKEKLKRKAASSGSNVKKKTNSAVKALQRDEAMSISYFFLFCYNVFSHWIKTVLKALLKIQAKNSCKILTKNFRLKIEAKFLPKIFG